MLTADIILTADFTGKPSQVKIYQPAGGGNGYYVSVDGWYEGVMISHDGQWRGYWNDKAFMNFEPLGVLVEIITTHPNYRAN